MKDCTKFTFISSQSQVQWLTPLTPVFGRQRRPNLCGFKASLVLHSEFWEDQSSTVRPCLNKIEYNQIYEKNLLVIKGYTYTFWFFEAQSCPRPQTSPHQVNQPQTFRYALASTSPVPGLQAFTTTPSCYYNLKLRDAHYPLMDAPTQQQSLHIRVARGQLAQKSSMTQKKQGTLKKKITKEGTKSPTLLSSSVAYYFVVAF